MEIDCLSESAWVVWQAAAGAEFYVVVATNRLGEELRYECNATDDSVCNVPDMRCSQQLDFALVASDQQCSSAPSNVITADTGERDKVHGPRT